MLTLYAAKGTVALACHIALEESGLPYEVVWVDFSKGDQHKTDYLKINPKGRVPALKTAHGIITETFAILTYIAERTEPLDSETIMQDARANEMMSFLASTMHVNHAHGLRQSRWSDDTTAYASMAAKVAQNMADDCAYIEKQLNETWVTGRYSIADMHLYAVCRCLASDGVDIVNYPKLAAHFTAMAPRPAVARVSALHG